MLFPPPGLHLWLSLLSEATSPLPAPCNTASIPSAPGAAPTQGVLPELLSLVPIPPKGYPPLPERDSCAPASSCQPPQRQPFSKLSSLPVLNPMNPTSASAGTYPSSSQTCLLTKRLLNDTDILLNTSNPPNSPFSLHLFPHCQPLSPFRLHSASQSPVRPQPSPKIQKPEMFH